MMKWKKITENPLDLPQEEVLAIDENNNMIVGNLRQTTRDTICCIDEMETYVDNVTHYILSEDLEKLEKEE